MKRRPTIKLKDKNLETAFNAVLDYIDAKPEAKKIYAGNGLTMQETPNSITLNQKGVQSIQDVTFMVNHPFRVYIENFGSEWSLLHDIGTLNGFPSNLGEKTIEEFDSSKTKGSLTGWVYWEAEMDGVSCTSFVVNFDPNPDPPNVVIDVARNTIPTVISGLVAFIDNGRIYQMLKRNLNVKLDLVMQAQSGDGSDVDNFYSLVPYEI